MSLQLWLPFRLYTGKINKGLSNIELSGSLNGVGSGKLGWCAKFTNNPSSKLYANTNIFNYTGSFSFCTWIRRDDVSTYPQCVFSVGDRYGIIIREDNKIRPWCKDLEYPKSCPHGEWHHIAFTASGNEFKIYLDGKLSTKVSESSPTADSYEESRLTIGWGHNATDGDIYPFYGSLNDFRIYDHCLSAKEVKEISKGLVIHNKFSAPGADNLIENSYDCSGWTIDSDFVQSIDPDDGSTILSFSRTGSTSAASRVAYSGIIPSDIDISNGITVSFDFKCDSIANLTDTRIVSLNKFWFSNSTNGNITYSTYQPVLSLNNIQDDKWVHVWVHFSNSILSTNYGMDPAGTITGYSIAWQLVRDGSVHFKKMKVELGDKSTPWIPNRNDALFDILNLNASYIDYTGSDEPIGTPHLTTDISFSNDTPRYNACYKFNGGIGIMNGPVFYAAGYNYEYTISLWAKYTSTLEFTIGNISVVADTSTISVTDKNNSLNASFSIPSGISTSDWHLYTICCATSSSSSFDFYIDTNKISVLFNNIDGDDRRMSILLESSSSYNVKILNTIGTSLCDFRVYSTILTASDINELYSGPISIDKDGNLLASEFEEE